MLALARRNVPTGRFVAMDFLELDTSLGGFDAVVAFFSLLMLRRSEIPQVVRRIRTVLRPGGLVAIGMVEGDLDYFPLTFLGQEMSVTAYPRVRPGGDRPGRGAARARGGCRGVRAGVRRRAGGAADLPLLRRPLTTRQSEDTQDDVRPAGTLRAAAALDPGEADYTVTRRSPR